MAYQERIKNFERIRGYMREFFVYGCKMRNEYDEKSARTYDDERKHIESWLGDYLKCTYREDGKINYLSIDSRSVCQNPLYKALKTCSFTDPDITLHFAFMALFPTADIELTVQEIVSGVDAFLSHFSDASLPDQSTIRKKLNEYETIGLLKKEKTGRKICYRRADDLDISEMADAISFFSEAIPCGVIGSFIQDSQHHPVDHTPFRFKQAYFASALDSDVMCRLLCAIRKEQQVEIKKTSLSKKKETKLSLIPLRIASDAQTGREYLLAYDAANSIYQSLRVDFITSVDETGSASDFAAHRKHLGLLQQHMWGVALNNDLSSLEHIEVHFRAELNEQHIIRRLTREKRCGSIEKIDDTTWRFTADVTNTAEMLPWLRTYLSRIVKLEMSNKSVYKTFMADLQEMARRYGLAGGAEK